MPQRGALPINVPQQLAVRSSLLGLTARAAFRFLPYIGWGLTAYELYQWYKGSEGAPRSAEGACGEGPFTHSQRHAGGGFDFLLDRAMSACGTPLQVANDRVRPFDNVHTLFFEGPGTGTRFTFQRWFIVPPGYGDVDVFQPGAPPVAVPPLMPEIPAWIDPLPQPIQVPLPVPVAPPYELIPERKPNPDRVERSDWGYDAPPLPGQAQPLPEPVPYPMPRPARPPSNVRERKVLSAKAKIVFYLWDKATEAPDWVDAFYEALPDDLRRDLENAHGRPPNLITRAKWTYDHYQEIDLETAFENAVYNLVEDAAAGRINKLLNDAGVGSGFGGQPYILQEFL